MKSFNNILNCGFALLGVAALAGCHGFPVQGERRARQDLKAVGDLYRPGDWRPTLPELSADAGLSNFLAYALLNQPRVEAAYYDWAGAVERITVERSLPDPQLTFESDIADTVMTVMPGIMQMFPGPGKLKAAARVATAESQAKYFAFESAVLQTAFELKRSFYELYFLDERIRINRGNLALLEELERIARAQNEVGKGTLQDVLRAQIATDRVVTDIANLDDSRRPLRAMFKAALGLTPDQADPPVPSRLESTELDLQDDEILRLAFARNPRLKEMEAEVRVMQGEIAMAYKENVPDFSLGLMADVKAAPTMFRPLATMTLPVWRDRIAAGIARAKAGELAARARLTGEQIMLAASFAEKSFALRDLTRNLALLRDQLIPKTRQSVEIARGGYLSGTIEFFDLIDAERMLLEFEMSETEARTRREIVLAEISLTIAGVAPSGAPVLPSVAAGSTQTINSPAK